MIDVRSGSWISLKEALRRADLLSGHHLGWIFSSMIFAVYLAILV